MPGIFRISEAAALALHTAAYLAASPDRRTSVREMAALLSVSENHLAKVMQRLAKSGLVASHRGPAGGFTLARPADEVTLLDVYEAIEGPFTPVHCLLGKPVCAGKKRILGNLLHTLNREFRDYMSSTTLADAAGVYGKGASR